MAKYGSPSVPWLLWRGFDLLPSSILKLDGPKVSGVLEPSHGLGEGWEASKATGLKKATVKVEGFYDDETAGINEALNGQQNTTGVLCCAFGGGTAGAKFTGAVGAVGGEFERVSTRGQLHKANAGLVVTGQVEDGIVLKPLLQVSGTGDTQGAESQDHGASSSQGGVGYLQVVQCAGVTSVLCKVRHSADDTTYADLVTFTAVTPWTPPAQPPAVAAQRIVVAGTVNRHLAASWTFTGAGTITPMVGFARA